MTNPTQPLDAAIDEILEQHREWMRGIRTDYLVGTSSSETKAAILALLARETTAAPLRVTREWVMPNKWTFTMKPIQKIFSTYVLPGEEWADPFAGFNSPAVFANDIEEDRPTTHHIDALDFLKSFDDDSLDGVLFDPPYSVEQCLRKYTPRFKGTAGRAEYWAKCKDEIKRIVRPGGQVISFCWDSTGIGKKRGFSIIEVKLLCHGACHNDTIVTVEQKIPKLQATINVDDQNKLRTEARTRKKQLLTDAKEGKE